MSSTPQVIWDDQQSSSPDVTWDDEPKSPHVAVAPPATQTAPTPQQPSTITERLRAAREGTYRPGESTGAVTGIETADTKPSQLAIDPISGQPREKVLSTAKKAQAVAQGNDKFDPIDQEIIRKHDQFGRMTQAQLETANKYAVQPFERIAHAGAEEGKNLAERALVTPQTEIPMPDMPAPPLSQEEVRERLKGLPAPVVGTTRAVGSAVGGMVADPRMWPFFLAGPEVSPALRAATGIGFTAQMGAGAVEQAGELGRIMDNPDVPQADKWEAGANSILTTIMAGTGGAHLGEPALERLREFQRLKPEDQQGIRARLREKAPDVAAEMDKATGGQQKAPEVQWDDQQAAQAGKSKTQQKIGYKLPRNSTAAKVDGEVAGRNVGTVTLDNGETWAFDKRKVNADAVKGYADRGELWRLEGKKAPPEAAQQAEADLRGEEQPAAAQQAQQENPKTAEEMTPQQREQAAQDLRADLNDRRAASRGPDRRQDLEFRRRVEELSPEERAQQLLTSRKTGLPNDRAFDEDAQTLAESHPHVGYADLDDFKRYNDALGHQGVDEAVLPMVGDYFRDAAAKEPGGSVKVYHRSGDEFNFRSSSPEAIKRVVDRVNEQLAKSTFVYQTPDGKLLEKKGTGLSHGVGRDQESAETAADADKQRRKAAGLREGARDLQKVDTRGAAGQQAALGENAEREGVSAKQEQKEEPGRLAKPPAGDEHASGEKPEEGAHQAPAGSVQPNSSTPEAAGRTAGSQEAGRAENSEIKPTVNNVASPDIQLARTEAGKIKLGADVSSLGKVLGSSLYQGRAPKIITKELIQNAFDAVRASSNKEIHVDLDTRGPDGIITVSDTGKGMSKDELETVFTDLGSSGKRGQEDASGGFGLAKAAPLMMSKRLEIKTVVDEGGKRLEHSFVATPEQMLGEGVDVSTKEVGHSVPTGTAIKAFVDKSDGMWSAETFVRDSRKSLNAPGELSYSSNGKDQKLQEHQLEKQPMTKAAIPGAEITIYRSREINPIASTFGALQVEIHNNGIYQFDNAVYNPGAQLRGMPTRVAVDVHATVPEGDKDYPFLANRESLRSAAQSAINEIIKNEIIQPAVSKEREIISQLYHSLPTVAGTKMPLFDAGGRFKEKELNEMQSNPVVRELAEKIKSLVSRVIDKSRASGMMPAAAADIGKTIKRVGLVFSDNIHGVFITDPKDTSHATLLIDPFNHVSDSPWNAASLIWHTIKHEIVHDVAKGHDETFTTLEKDLSRSLGQLELHALRELSEVYGDPNNQDRLRPDINRPLQIYRESRGRPATQADIFGGENLRRGGEHESDREGRDAGSVRESGTGIVRKGDAVILPDGREGTVQYVHPGMNIARVKTADGKTETVGLKSLKDKNGERGSSTPAAMPIPALISSAAGVIKKGSDLYHGTVDKLLDWAHMGQTRPEIRQFDSDAADLATKMDAAGQYHKAVAEMISKKVTGPLTEEFSKSDNYAERQKKNDISRDRMKGFHFLADKQNREWLEENHPEEYKRWSNDPKISAALKAYKPFEEQLRDAVKQLGGKTIDEDYIKRIMDFATSGIAYEGAEGRGASGQGKTAIGGSGRDNVVSPQIDRSKARKDAGQYYWDHGVFDFGPSFEKRWVEVMSKLDEHRLAVHAMSMGTRIAPGEEAPDKAFYNGQEFYRPDIAKEIREVQKRGVSAESKAMADALGVSELPSPKNVREYSFYEPLRRGSRFENAATSLARNVIAGKEDLTGQAVNLNRMAQLKYALPKEIVEALNDAGRERETGALPQMASKLLSPLTQFIRQQIVGLAYGVPHMANIMRKVAQAHPGAALNPMGWVDAFKVAFSKELKARGIKGVEDPTYNMLLRNAAISEGAIPEYKHYIEGNLASKNWQEIGKTAGNAFRKGGRANAKVTPGSAVAGIGRLAIEPLNRFSEGGHNNLFKQGAIDQRARIWLAGFLKDRYPGISEQRIAHEVNQALGRYNRASWTDVQKGLGPFMLFPGWDYSSMAFALKYPFKTAVAPAVLMLLANSAVRSIGANTRQDSKDTEGVHVGKYRIRTNLLNDNMGGHLWGWALRGATAGLQGHNRKEVTGEMVKGVPGDVAGVSTGTLNPIISTPIQIGANRVAPGRQSEIIQQGDIKKKGAVLPNKGAEDLVNFGAKRMFPLYDRMTQASGKPSLASFAGTVGVNISEKNKKRH